MVGLADSHNLWINYANLPMNDSASAEESIERRKYAVQKALELDRDPAKHGFPRPLSMKILINLMKLKQRSKKPLS